MKRARVIHQKLKLPFFGMRCTCSYKQIKILMHGTNQDLIHTKFGDGEIVYTRAIQGHCVKPMVVRSSFSLRVIRVNTGLAARSGAASATTCRQNTSSRAHFSRSLSVRPPRIALRTGFRFTRTCVAQDVSRLRAVKKNLLHLLVMSLLGVPRGTSSFCSMPRLLPPLTQSLLHTTGIRNSLTATPRLGGQSGHLADTTQLTQPRMSHLLGLLLGRNGPYWEVLGPEISTRYPHYETFFLVLGPFCCGSKAMNISRYEKSFFQHHWIDATCTLFNNS